MGNKNQFSVTLNWQSANPATGFLPINNNTKNGSAPSGVIQGPMASTNTIYSQIIEKSVYDNIGAEVNFNYGGGSAVGTLSVMASNSGLHFYALTFSPALGQPAGTSGGYVIDLNQYPFKYIMFQYTNSSGSGNLSAYLQLLDLN